METEEGKTEYLLWMADLVERAQKILPTIPMEVSGDGELTIYIHVDDKDIPMSIKKNPEFVKNDIANFKIEYKIKSIILEEIDKIAEKRKKAAEDDEIPFLYSDEEIYDAIEKAIVKDFCEKALKAKDFAIEAFHKASNFIVKHEDGNNIIVPVFSEDIVKATVQEKTKPLKRKWDKFWKWYNGD